MPGLADCLGQIDENIISKNEMNTIIASADKYKQSGNLSDKEAAQKALLDYHKQLHEELNKLRKSIGVGVKKYEPQTDKTEQIKKINSEYETLITNKKNELENASTQISKQQQESVQRSSEQEHARTEQAGSEGKTAGTESGNRNKRSEIEEKVKKSVLEKDITDISIDDILNEIKSIRGDADISNDLLKSDSQQDIETYISKAKGVLETLYPNAKLETYTTSKEFEKAGGESGTRGYAIMGKEGNHRILLNLEQIREDNSGKTATHEVIHPIVYDAFGVSSEKLIPIWNDIATDMENVPGMEKVFQHIQWYSYDKIAAEGLTETLTQIANGNIDLKHVPKSTANKIIDLVNKLFEALNIDYRINSINDFGELANKVKTAFDTATGEVLKDVVKGGNIDKFIADFERLSVKDIRGDRLQQLKELLRKKLQLEVDAGNLTQTEADKIFKDNFKDTEDFGKERFSDLSKKERQRGAYDHLIDSKISQKVIDKFKKEKDLKYKVADSGEAQEFGKAIIKSFGVDEALRLAKLNTFHPSVNSAVFAESIDHYRNLEIKEKEPQAKFNAAKKWADTFDEYAELLTGAGQFSSYAYNFYKTSKLGFLLSAEKKFKEKQDWFIGRDEKSINEAYDKLMEIPEFSELFIQKVEEAKGKSKQTLRTEQKKKISDAWDSIKLSSKNTYAIPVPPQIINGAIEAMKRATLLGYDVVNIVKDGIDYINKHHKDGWDEEKFKEDFTKKVDGIYKAAEVSNQQRLETYKDNLRKQIKDLDEQISAKQRKAKTAKEFELDDEAKQLKEQRNEKRKELNEVVPLEKTAQKILDKWEKKLNKLTPEAKKQLASKIVNEIVQHGGLDRETFQRLYAEALGLPTLTAEMKDKLIELGGKLNAVDEAKEALEKEPTQENINAYEQAMKEGEIAGRKINDLLGEKDITLDRFLSIAKLNTLGVANLLMNPLYNVAYMPFRFGESLVMTGLDYGLKYIGFPRKEGVYENTWFKQAGYFPGMAEGISKSLHGIIKGEQQYDFFKKSTRQNITPLGSFKEILSHHKGEKPLTTKEYANAVMEAFPTMGVTAAIISRSLQLGDLPFRFAAERATAENIARQKGLTGIKKDAFLLNPDEASKDLITKSGDQAVQSQTNYVTDFLNRISGFLKQSSDENTFGKIAKGTAKVIGATTQPFLKTPLNNAITVTQLVIPELAVAQGVYHAIKGQRTEALRMFGRATVGYAIGAAFSQLAAVGLISATDDEEEKINTSIYKEDISGGNHLNITGLKRYLSGGEPVEQGGDLKINLNLLGVSGAIMGMYGAKYDKLPPSEWQKLSYLDGLTDRFKSGFVGGVKNNVFGNTSTLVAVLSDGNAYKLNKWLRGSLGVLENAFDPSWLSMASKISDNYRPDYSAMGTVDQLIAQLKERTWMGKDLPSQITVWGEKRGDAPKGRNDFVYNYLDISKSRNVDINDFGYNILALYNRTKEDKVIPSRPQKTIRANNHAIQLTPKLYEEYQILVGKARKNLVQILMNTAEYNNASDDVKVKALQNQYESGYQIGKLQMMQLHMKEFQDAGILPKPR